MLAGPAPEVDFVQLRTCREEPIPRTVRNPHIRLHLPNYPDQVIISPVLDCSPQNGRPPPTGGGQVTRARSDMSCPWHRGHRAGGSDQAQVGSRLWVDQWNGLAPSNQNAAPIVACLVERASWSKTASSSSSIPQPKPRQHQ